jgi:hypothetical protein
LGGEVLDIRELRHIREESERIIKMFVEEMLPSRFSYSPYAPEAKGQYWEVEFTVWEDESTPHSFSCGCFTGSGVLANQANGIEQFFKNNDRVLEEFSNAVESCAFNDLIPILECAAGLCAAESGGASITVDASVVTSDEWTRYVCEECVLIVHMDESGARQLELGCMQNERYRIKMPSENGDVYIRVPFDKVQSFRGHERVESYSDSPYRLYEVALSFAGEDRGYVGAVAKALKERRVRVFYDEFESVTLWGKDLYVHLDDIYRKQARYCVMFLSENYKNKLWTNHERESAQARAFEERSDYILPVKIDDTEIPGVRPTVGYIDKLPPRELAELVVRKVRS